MYAALRKYRVDPQNVGRIVKEGVETAVPLLRAIPGFVAYTLADGGDGTLTSYSVYETRAGADELVRRAAAMVRQKLADLLPTPPEVTTAEVRVRESVRDPPAGTIYGVMRRYQVDAGNVEQIVARAREGFVPLLRGQPGFVSYQILDAGDGRLISLTGFTTRQGADDSVTRAAGWVRDNVAALVPNPPEVTRSEIKLRAMAESKARA